MAKIIMFPVPEQAHSNSYLNLIQFFEVCTSAKSCEFYLSIVEDSAEKGFLRIGELEDLRKIGANKKRLLDASENLKTGTYAYTPEMGQEKPQNCEIEMHIGHYGGYFLKTTLELKGRGITKLDDCGGKHCYKCTERAYKKLEQAYRIAYESNLD